MPITPNQPENLTLDHEESRRGTEPVATRSISQSPNASYPETVAFDGGNAANSSLYDAGSTIADRYVLQNEIARGGMGVVFSARDTKLNREVAVKFLLERISIHSITARRFFEEAQIAAQLQHPGIAPVHDLGTLSNGRPFLAMKLIKGKTLAVILAEEKPDAYSLTELFANIAKTMAYVHSKGVIHRDLKPSNIMVGAFGEIQIMDWGLAKTIASGSTLDAESKALAASTNHSVSVVETERTPDSATQAGSILGTPAYMPPEQAKGDIDHTDARSDVFALGAILCEMLTGKPPYVGKTFEEIRAQSIIGLVQPAIDRLKQCNADEELITLSTQCLSPDPANRPADASKVGEAIDAYRTNVTDRLRRAEQEKASADIRIAEQQKRRKLLIGVGCVLGFAAIAFVIYQNVQNRQLEQQTIAAKQAEAETLVAKKESDQNAHLAQRRLEKAVQAVEAVITRVAGEKWALKPELQEERREVLVEAVAFFNGLGSEDSKDPIVQRQAARANLFASAAMMSLAEYDQCEVAAKTAANIYRGMQKEAPSDSSLLRGESEAVGIQGHINAIRAHFAEAMKNYKLALDLAERAEKLEPDRDENQLAIASCCSSLALYYSFQSPERSREYHFKALAIGEKLCNKPTTGFNARLVVANSLVNLAIPELNSVNWAKSKTYIDQAEVQIKLLDSMKPPSPRAMEMFYITKASLDIYHGMYMNREKKVEEGLTHLRSGIEMLNRMLTIQPKSFPFQIQLLQFQIVYAQLLLANGQTQLAEKSLQEVDRLQKLLAESHPQVGWVKSLGMMQKSLLIVNQVRDAYTPSFEAETEKLIEEYGRLNPAMIYNAACIYAQASDKADEKDRPRFAERAMKLLNRLLVSTDYYNTEINSNHMDADNDLDPLRKRQDFQDFEKKVKAKVEMIKKKATK